MYSRFCRTKQPLHRRAGQSWPAKIVKRSPKTLAYMLAIGLVLGLCNSTLQAQEYGTRLGTVKRGGKVSYEPTGPGVLFDALDPVVRKWYIPQELYAEYGWKQLEYSNYARNPYQRYVSTSIEGDYFYDVYGNFLTRGWLIYDWREENPQPFGSSLFKSGLFSSWFSRLVVAADHKGQYHYAITVGDEIRTTLTPMTFSKPKFNGLQWDFASDKYNGTLLLSRISAPNPEFITSTQGNDQRTDATNLVGGRLEFQLGDFVKVGGVLVNAYQSNTQTGAFGTDLVRGQLSGPQNFAELTSIQVRISDDSPEDGEGGGALFSSDILIWDLEGNQTRGSEIGFRAQTEGGFLRQGFLAADGNEQILLLFDFTSPTYVGPDPGLIKRAVIELVISNDYFIEVTSDRQIETNNIVFLPVARADDNVKDSSNQQVISFDYGLPTANQIVGFTFELDDLTGLKAYGEIDFNRRFTQYPNTSLNQHQTASQRSDAWFFNVSKTSYPYFAFAEGFSIAPDYSTGMPLLNKDGNPNYTRTFQRFEFVEDNDDQDQFADWFRKGSGSTDREVFPGWDENNDFISDFNQNDNFDSPNLIPDYEESFLRFDVDRPEFLYGIDMNHNGTIDRFENDEEPDYPYRLGQRGYNVYGGTFIGPKARLTLGRQRVRQIATGRRNRATYLLFSLDQNRAGLGRLRLHQDLRKVADSIPDDLLQWVQSANTRGSQQFVRDVLPAQDAWVNTTWIGLDLDPVLGLRQNNIFKWETYRQQGGDDEIELRGVRQTGGFLGLINKAEYRLNIGSYTALPRWKSEYRHITPVARSLPERQELSEIFMLILRHPFLRRSLIEGGVEYQWFNQLRDPTPPGAEADFTSLVFSAQLTNVSDYQGYRLTSVMGFEVARLNSSIEETLSRTRGFVSIYAGVER